MKNNKIAFVDGIVFFIVGLIIFFNPDSVVKFISYLVGGLLIGIGAYKCASYYVQDKRNGIVNRNEMAFGVTAIVLGVLFVCLAGAIELIIRFIIGGWLLIAGISRIASSFYTTDRDKKFYALLVVGILLIIVGLYIIFVSNLALSLIGLIMAIYGVIDFVSYFVYKDSFKSDIKQIEIKEAEVEEKE